MTGQQDAIRGTAGRILNLTFQDDAVSTTFGDYLRRLSAEPEAGSLPMSPRDAKALLDVLERLANSENRLTHSQKEMLKDGFDALLEDNRQVKTKIDDFKLRINNNRGDVDYAAIERLSDEQGILDSFFPDRPDAALNEGQRVEFLEMQRDWSKRGKHLDKIIGQMIDLTRLLGISVDPPTPQI